MNDAIVVLMKKLTRRSVLERKEAIAGLKRHMGSSHMARLSLGYISEHDPSFTVRNMARSALSLQEKQPIWERSYIFAE